ncbi:MAG: neutral/alkaline non-lysosomal ceramidase N-terminal domain-containing protein [Planctomycetaceae bacterium]|nr:neutral/alkaline non-lysosomal ceramidase N-terminal domain-containing protein [Planctomycetaceae bacterium]
MRRLPEGRSMIVGVSCLLSVSMLFPSGVAQSEESRSAPFSVGYAETDITPPPGLPMWGYGARHALPAVGALDPLLARAIVVQAGDEKLAIMSLDLGRGPTAAMMDQIRTGLREAAGIGHVLISGTHTHHGPVIELTDRDGFGKGTFPEAVEYSRQLSQKLMETALAADRSCRPARIGVATRSDLELNRNRQTKRSVKARDPMLGVIRFDDESGTPIALVVNFAAHPVMTNAMELKYSADYPGFLAAHVRQELNCGCLFMQGASGDMSVNAPADANTPALFGQRLGELAVELASQAETIVPASPSIGGRVDPYRFHSRIKFDDPLVRLQYSAAFFPELIQNALGEFSDGIPAELNTVVLNGNLALVGGSGEFFCNHANRLKERSYLDHTFFFGYCNGHSLYFPTIEAVSEGGYGADAPVSPVEIGAGEQMMNRALMNIYTLVGRMEAITPTQQESPPTSD